MSRCGTEIRRAHSLRSIQATSLICLTKGRKYNNLNHGQHSLCRGRMIKTKAAVLAAVITSLCVLSGCLGKDNTSGRLYFEPPARLIDDYTGMVEVMELNWAWSQPGFKLGNYQNLSI